MVRWYRALESLDTWRLYSYKVKDNIVVLILDLTKDVLKLWQKKWLGFCVFYARLQGNDLMKKKILDKMEQNSAGLPKWCNVAEYVYTYSDWKK